MMSPHVVSSLIGSHIDGPPVQEFQTGSLNGLSLESTRPRKDHVNRSHLKPTPVDDVHDVVCVGFGPASLAIAVALHDTIEDRKLRGEPVGAQPKVLFLEKQAQFAWHAGMLLPGAKMQISFIKDMATLRNPRSEFTFINFLHENGRLIDFTNLSTFLPARVEYEEYLRWCAEHFNNVVRYENEVVGISPVDAPEEGAPVSQFVVTSRNKVSGEVSSYRARNVIVAIGGQPKLPKFLPASHPRVLHSSQYAHMVPQILKNRDAPYRVAVIGAGQSAAEIFHNVQNLYPNSRTSLVMRSEFMRPSDDSPFVNTIFNPSYIDTLYPRSAAYRKNFLADARSTNYAVVRLELIEALYERMYDQRRELGPDETKWPHRVRGGTEVVGVESGDSDDEPLRLRIRPLSDVSDGDDSGIGSVDGHSEAGDEILEADLVISATGYQRKLHLTMLNDIMTLLPEKDDTNGLHDTKESTDPALRILDVPSKSVARDLRVGRNYGVQFSEGKVAQGSGVWLQGCNEGTHGLSDTLLSVLATRSGEIVNSIFGNAKQK